MNYQQSLDYQKTCEELSAVAREFFRAKAPLIKKIVNDIARRLKSGRKILIFGNGGSAAESQHFAAEMVNKFMRMRKPLPAIALTTDTSTLTSIGNDMGFDFVFSRQVEALAGEGDIALALSTSGKSPNIIEGVKAAKKKKLLTAALTGEGGGQLAPLADFLFDVPSKSTPRIQEVHLLFLHILAQELEEKLV